MELPNSDIYKGELNPATGELSGLAYYHSIKNKLLLIGTYSSGHFDGVCAVFYLDQGLVYYGHVKQSMKHGLGVLMKNSQ